MSARIPGSLLLLAAMLLLAACATSPTYHSDRGGDYYYGTSAADVVIDAAPGYRGWGFGGGFGYGGYGGYGGYYSPWAWHGGYGYGHPPWWRYGHAPIAGRPHHDRHPAPRNALLYSPRSNVRAEREQPGPVRIDAQAAPRAFPAAPRAEPRSVRDTMLPSSGYAPVPRVAPQRAVDRHSSITIPAPRAAPSPVAAPRSAPPSRAAPAAPPAQRAPAPRPSGKHGADRR